MFRRLLIVILFSIAFAYIESAVVVYLRVIFHPDGFSFPLPAFGLNPLWRRLIMTEVGREAATMAVIACAAWLFGRSCQERLAYALVMFAVWDIFYYVWLKVLLDWPASILDWDILFLIPVAWASPVLYPVLVSLAMLAMAVIVLWRSEKGNPVRLGRGNGIALVAGCAIIVVSFCIGGSHITKPDYADYFSWPLFAAGYVLAVVAFGRALIRKLKIRAADCGDLRSLASGCALSRNQGQYGNHEPHETHERAAAAAVVLFPFQHRRTPTLTRLSVRLAPAG